MSLRTNFSPKSYASYVGSVSLGLRLKSQLTTYLFGDSMHTDEVSCVKNYLFVTINTNQSNVKSIRAWIVQMHRLITTCYIDDGGERSLF